MGLTSEPRLAPWLSRFASRQSGASPRALTSRWIVFSRQDRRPTACPWHSPFTKTRGSYHYHNAIADIWRVFMRMQTQRWVCVLKVHTVYQTVDELLHIVTSLTTGDSG